MKISRRNFLTTLTIGVAGLPLARGLSWAQAKGKLGYMRIVDNAAMFMAMEKGFFKAEGLGNRDRADGGRRGDRPRRDLRRFAVWLDERDFTLSGPCRRVRFQVDRRRRDQVRGNNETHAIVVGKTRRSRARRISKVRPLRSTR